MIEDIYVKIRHSYVYKENLEVYVDIFIYFKSIYESTILYKNRLFKSSSFSYLL